MCDQARAGGTAHHVKHPSEWIKPGQVGSALGGGRGGEFGPYIRPTPVILSSLEQARAIMPERNFAKDLKWENSSHYPFLFNPRDNEEDLCPQNPPGYEYLRPKLKHSNPKPPTPPHPPFPKWVDAGTCPMYFSKTEPMASSNLTPNQLAAMVAPTRNFDNSISIVTEMPIRSSWQDFATDDSLRLGRDDQGRTGTVIE